MQTWLSKRKQKEREKPMDGFMDCTNFKANMVLIHAVCVRSKGPTPCPSEEDVYLEKLMLTGTVEVQCGGASGSGISRYTTSGPYSHSALLGLGAGCL